MSDSTRVSVGLKDQPRSENEALRPTVTIAPESSAVDWLELWRYRDLLRILAERDVRIRYRQTFLGATWVILQPIVSAALFAVVFGLFAGLPSTGAPYFLLVLSALVAWNLVAGGLQRAGNSLVSQAPLITKIYFPRALLPIASLSAGIVDFVVALSVVVAVGLLVGVGLGVQVVALPAFVLLGLTIALGASFFFSALNVYYRDFAYMLPFLIQVWLYASPVAYSSELIPERFRWIYGLNPMVGVIDGFRWSLLGTELYPVYVLESALIAPIVLAVGALIFKRVERHFADVI